MAITGTPRSAAAFCAVIAVVTAGCGLATAGLGDTLAQDPDTEKLQGVWRVVEEVDRRADGTLVSAGPSQGYDGLLIFTGSGYMSSTIMPKGRKWTIASASQLQLRETIEAGSAHAGRYEIDANNQILKIENSVSMNPADAGQWDAVHYAFGNDTLTLSGSWTYNGEKLSFAISLVPAR